MSTLSEYLNEHLPAGWQKPQLVEALSGKLDRATVYKYLAGNHPRNPHDSVLAAFASVLPNVSVVELRAAANLPPGAEEPWVPPIEANRLTQAQRRSLEAFIKATVAISDEAELQSADTAPEPASGDREMTDAERVEIDSYVEQLNASGREDLAERVASAIVDGSAAETAHRASVND